MLFIFCVYKYLKGPKCIWNMLLKKNIKNKIDR